MNRKTKRGLIIIGALLTVSLLLIPISAGCKAPAPTPSPTPTAPEAAEEVITWNFHTAYKEAFYLGGFNKKWADLVEEKTNGRLKINLFYSAGLGYKYAEVLPAMREGVLDSAEVLGSIVASEVSPWWSYDGFVEFLDNVDQANYVLDKMLPQIHEDMREYGIVPLAFYNATPDNMVQGFFTNFKLDSFDQLEGLVVRLYYPLAREAQFKPLGMEAIFIPGPEIYHAMKTGVVDAIYQNPPVGITSKYCELADYYYLTQPANLVTWGLACSPVSLSKLPEDMQQAVIEAGKEHEDFVRYELYPDMCAYTLGSPKGEYGGDWCVKEAIDWLKDYGMEIYRVDNLHAEIQKLGREAWPKWAAETGGFAQTLNELMLEAIEKYPGVKNRNYLDQPNVTLTGTPKYKK